MLWIGCDPGLDGSIALLDDRGLRLAATPIDIIKSGTKTKPKKKREFLYKEMAQILIEELMECAAEDMFCVIEKSQVMPKQGAVSGHKTGLGMGIWLGIFGALSIPHEAVRPRIWQSEMYKGYEAGNPKETSRIVALELFPDVNFKRTERSKKSHDGFTDAALIAEYARRKYLGWC